MTASERKRLGKHWKTMNAELQAKHPGFQAYYEEFKTEIDAELAGGN